MRNNTPQKTKKEETQRKETNKTELKEGIQKNRQTYVDI